MSGSAWKAVAVIVTVLLGVLTQYEVDNDVLMIEKEVALPVTRAKAFLYLADMTNMRTWFPGIDHIEATDSMPMGVGKHFTETSLIPVYGAMQSDIVVMGYESPRYISFMSDGWLQHRVEMELDRTDEIKKHPTKLTWRMYSRRKSYLFNYLLSPVISYFYGYNARQALFGLRYVLQES